MFEAVNATLSSWFKGIYKKDCYKPGFILTLHTFGRDDKWNVLLTTGRIIKLWLSDQDKKSYQYSLKISCILKYLVLG